MVVGKSGKPFAAMKAAQDQMGLKIPGFSRDSAC